jgi:hypothetical protein
MAGYSARQSTFTTGDTITAAHSNNEFNQLLAAFNASTGHTHDGTAGDGGPVKAIRDSSNFNRVLIDDSNNHLEFYVNVSSASVQQFRLEDGAIVPITNNDIDLGTSSLQFKDAFFDGTVTLDGLTFGAVALTSVDTDLSSVSGSDDTLASAKAIKAYVDAQIQTEDTLVELNDTNISTPSGGHILVYDGSDSFDNKALSGDVTMDSNGAVTIANDAVETAMVNDNVLTGQSELTSVASDDVILIYDTDATALKKITRSNLVAGLATSSALNNISEDTTPQLGGNLDVNGQDIVSTSNANIDIIPNGSGIVNLDGTEVSDGLIELKTGTGSVAKVKFYCESGNAHAQTLQAQPHSAASSAILTLPVATGTLVGTGDTGSVSNGMLGTGIDAAKLADGSISNTEFQYLNGVSSAIQTQIDAKASNGFAVAMAIAL